MINNVETLANIPLIILNGGEWLHAPSVPKEQGDQGLRPHRQDPNTGLVEVPMGITLREMVFDIGGGIRDGRKFKAVQTGGPSGGFIPPKFLNTPNRL